MKKSLFNTVMALCIGLFASCSQEEIISQTSSGAEEAVSIDAQLPNLAHTRALPGAEANHQLRCILEVWDKAEGGKLITRIEKLASAVNPEGKLQFSFTVLATTNYQCLLWADFIASDATATDKSDNTTYADKYFDTSNLKAIDFKVDDATLFNNVSTDAFCGTVSKNGTSSQLSVTLKRPFTKVTLIDKSDYIKECKGLEVEYLTPSGYNIADGTTTKTKAVKATGLTPTDKTWFSTFIFASANKQKLDQDITMNVTKTDDTTEKKTIKKGQISLDSNIENNAEANFSADADVNIDVDVDPEFPDPNALKIGQFVNKDGSVSDTYDVANTIAIVFAAGAKKGDAAENYSGKIIAGYAMSINTVARALIYPKDGIPTDSQYIPEITNEIPWEEDYKGIIYSKHLIDKLDVAKTTMFKAETGNYPIWLNTNKNTVANLSDWYIPTASQALDCFGMLFGYTDGEGKIRSVAQNVTFRNAYDSTGKAVAFERPKGATNFLTSDVTAANYTACLQLTVPDPPAGNTGVTITKVFSSSLANTVMICPVLTIFKP